MPDDDRAPRDPSPAPPPGEAGDEPGGPRSGRVDREDDPPELSTRDVWRLIWASYRVSFPYFLVVVLGLALTTWIVTTLLF